MSTIVPITKARAKLGQLAKRVSGKDYVILTKGGAPTAALVDVKYLNKLETQIRKIFKKTFMDKELLKYTREFGDEEIEKWLEADEL